MTTALYRRHRPDTFQEVIGQEHVTAPLMAALRGDRVTHAYLFSGPRGCGKTTSARILARCLNCERFPTDTPCGTCPSCRDLATGGPGSLDVVEIDAASHNGVDDARDLRERASFAPARDRFKIFILDEAHMVTPQGFNALLKLVEEPPAHVKFIFATTEPEKVIGTIRSRTHHYPFRLVPPDVLEGYLGHLCGAEGVQVGAGVFPLVVRAGGGSVRDTLSVMDQLIGGAVDGEVDYQRAVALLGYTDTTLLDSCVDAIAAADGAGVFRVVDRVVSSGHDPRRFVEDLLARLRDLLVISLAGSEAGPALGSRPVDELKRMEVQARTIGAPGLSRSADMTAQALSQMVGATSPRLQLELLMARLLVPSAPGAGGLAPAPGAPAAGDSGDWGAPAAPGARPAGGGPGSGRARAAEIARRAAPAGAADQAMDQATAQQAPTAQTGSAGRAPAAPGGRGAGAGPAGDAPASPAPGAPAANAQAPDGAVRGESAPAPSGGPPPPGTEAGAPGGRGTAARRGESAPAPSGTPGPGQAGGDTAATHVRPRNESRRSQEPDGAAAAQPGAAGQQPDVHSSAGAADAEMIRARWEEVLDAAKRSRRATWALVGPNSQPGAIANGVFQVLFTSPGLVGAFENGGHGPILAAAIHQALGLQLEVHAILTGGDGPGGGGPGGAMTGALGRPGAPGRPGGHSGGGPGGRSGARGDASRRPEAKGLAPDQPAPDQPAPDQPAPSQPASDRPAPGPARGPMGAPAVDDDGWGEVAVPGSGRRGPTSSAPDPSAPDPQPADPWGGVTRPAPSAGSPNAGSPNAGGRASRDPGSAPAGPHGQAGPGRGQAYSGPSAPSPHSAPAPSPHSASAPGSHPASAPSPLSVPIPPPGVGQDETRSPARRGRPAAAHSAMADRSASPPEGPQGPAPAPRPAPAQGTSATSPSLATVHRIRPLPPLPGTPGVESREGGTGPRGLAPVSWEGTAPGAPGEVTAFSDGVPVPEEPGDPDGPEETWAPTGAAGDRVAAAMEAARAAARGQGRPAANPRSAVAPLEEDLPSEDDEDAEEAGVVGLEVVKRILGATVLEEITVTQEGH